MKPLTHTINACYREISTIGREPEQDPTIKVSAQWLQRPLLDSANCVAGTWRAFTGVEWQIGTQVVSAKGTFAVLERSSPQPWCENICAGWWTYELRIDSQDVRLQNQLVLTIETEDGTRLAKYLGNLSTAKQQDPLAI